MKIELDNGNRNGQLSSWSITLSDGRRMRMLSANCRTEEQVREVIYSKFPEEKKAAEAAGGDPR